MIEPDASSTHIRLLRSALDQAGDAFILTDCANKVGEWNEKAQRPPGWTGDEAIGRALCELIAPQRIRSRYERSGKRKRQSLQGTAGRKPIRIDTRHRDGHGTPVEPTTSVFEIGKDLFYWIEIRGGLCQALYENSLQQHAALLNLPRDSTIVRDLSFKLHFWNDGTQRLYGYTQDEAVGLIGEIDEWALRSAGRQNIQWQCKGFPAVIISVNLSPKQLGSSLLQQSAAQVLADTGLDARWLEFEVTRTGLMENIESALQILMEIRRFGVRISVDDFSTGFSSLARLKKLPIDALKIDESFIADVVNDPDDAAIVTATMAMVRSMDLKVVAEGVETHEQVDFLTNLGCEGLQGFYFSKALPASELERALRAGRWSDWQRW